MPLAAAAAEHPELLRERLGAIVPATDAFTARNEARWRDGLLVYVPDGKRLDRADQAHGQRRRPATRSSGAS